jgi:hypothetical protein
MDAAAAVRDFLEELKRHQFAKTNFLGLLHVLIGRRIARDDGTVISTGMTWRELALLLKKLRWEKERVADLGVDAKELPTRDREKYWYSAIARAGVDSPQAIKAGDKLAENLRKKGYVVSPAP